MESLLSRVTTLQRAESVSICGVLLVVMYRIDPHDRIRHDFLAHVNASFRHFSVKKRHTPSLNATKAGFLDIYA